MNTKTQNDLIVAYQNRVTRTISKIMFILVFVVPIYWIMLYIISLTEAFDFSDRYHTLIPSLTLSFIICVIPTLLLKIKTPEHIVKFFAVIPLSLVVVLFYVFFGVVIRLLFVMMPIISALYFDRKFIIRMSIVNYFFVLLGLYLASPQEVERYTVYETAGSIFLAKAISLSIEFLPIIIILVALAGFARGLMEKLAEAENEKFRAEIAEAKNKAKSAFLATMSHEIRTPMNAILGITQMELQDPDLPDKQISAFEKINDSGSTLLGIINDILDMSKIEAGKLELNPIEYDVASFIHDSYQLNAIRIGSKEIEFIIDIDENIPSRMIGDELRMRQILNNLLSNAFKYTEKGFVKLSITTVANPAPPVDEIRIRITVEDTGQGMKPEDMEKLFTEYTRFNEDTNRTTEGTGIGLNITSSLVNLMGGTINATSEYKKGSVFTVEIMQKAVADAVPIGTEASENLGKFIFMGKKERLNIEYDMMPYGRVLVVDDIDTNLYVARGLMAPYHLEIETVESGYKAIEILENDEKFDIVFMDHMMPGMDGIETTLKLREKGYQGTIIALTANAIVGNDVMFMENGFDDFISKPIDIRQLNAILNKWIRDKYPEEAAKYTSKVITSLENGLPGKRSELYKVFRNDAKKAVITLRETATKDLKLLTTTTHAMKAALLNIGENEKALLAGKLETAGRNNDEKYISENINDFIETLETLISKLTPNEIEIADDDITEDTVFLNEQLGILKNACDNYDEKIAYEVIDRLNNLNWKKDTKEALSEIRETLYFRSDFESAAQLVDQIINK